MLRSKGDEDQKSPAQLHGLLIAQKTTTSAAAIFEPATLQHRFRKRQSQKII